MSPSWHCEYLLLLDHRVVVHLPCAVPGTLWPTKHQQLIGVDPKFKCTSPWVAEDAVPFSIIFDSIKLSLLHVFSPRAPGASHRSSSTMRILSFGESKNPAPMHETRSAEYPRYLHVSADPSIRAPISRCIAMVEYCGCYRPLQGATLIAGLRC